MRTLPFILTRRCGQPLLNRGPSRPQPCGGRRVPPARKRDSAARPAAPWAHTPAQPLTKVLRLLGGDITAQPGSDIIQGRPVSTSASCFTPVTAGGTMTPVHGCRATGRALVQTGHGLLVPEPPGQADVHGPTCDPRGQSSSSVSTGLQGPAQHPCFQARATSGTGPTVKGAGTLPFWHRHRPGSRSSTETLSTPCHRSAGGPGQGLQR